eukprot:jgi/Chrzof1/2887/Cz12g02250.t1
MQTMMSRGAPSYPAIRQPYVQRLAEDTNPVLLPSWITFWKAGLAPRDISDAQQELNFFAAVAAAAGGHGSLALGCANASIFSKASTIKAAVLSSCRSGHAEVVATLMKDSSFDENMYEGSTDEACLFGHTSVAKVGL